MKLLVVFFACLAVSPALFAATPAPENAPARAERAPTSERRDRRFVTEVLRINHNETVIAQLIAERATRREVAALARQLIADLGEATRELREIAEKKRIPLPEPRSESGDLKTWNEKKLELIDADYLRRAQDALEDLSELYEKAAEKSADTDLAAFARKLFPAVDAQLERAQGINLDEPPPVSESLPATTSEKPSSPAK